MAEWLRDDDAIGLPFAVQLKLPCTISVPPFQASAWFLLVASCRKEPEDALCRLLLRTMPCASLLASFSQRRKGYAYMPMMYVMVAAAATTEIYIVVNMNAL
jgi:hypothetical protein